MRTAAQLANLKDRSNTAVSVMEAEIEKLNALIDKLEKDTSRSRGYIVEAVKEAREEALPRLANELARIRAHWTEASAQQRFWDSSALILSQQVFDADPAKDATIKLSLRAEFADTPAPLLQLAYEDARFENDLPRLWLIYTAGQRQTGINPNVASSLDMSFEGVEIPGQAVALAAISACHSNLEHGEMITAVATGLRINPVRKMTVGRHMAVTSRLVTAAEAVQSAAEQADEEAAAERSQ